MVQAVKNNGRGGAIPETEDMRAFKWTADLVKNVERKLKAVSSAEELKRLTCEMARPEFSKMIQQFVCPICTNVLDDLVCCSSCEGLMCRSCLNTWLQRDTQCPLCKVEFEEERVSRQVKNLLNMCEFNCPYGCGESFSYEHR